MTHLLYSLLLFYIVDILKKIIFNILFLFLKGRYNNCTSVAKLESCSKIVIQYPKLIKKRFDFQIIRVESSLELHGKIREFTVLCEVSMMNTHVN